MRVEAKDAPAQLPAALTGAIVVAAYITIGVPEASTGIAGRAILAEVGQPLQSLGLLPIALTAGYLTTALPHRWIMRFTGIGRLLVAVAAVAASGAFLFSVAQQWWQMLAGYYVLGVAAGGLDATLNSYVSLRHGSRMLSLMHGGFGIGATAGPVVVTQVLAHHASWRWVYAAVGAYEMVLLAVFLAVRRRWEAGGGGTPLVEELSSPVGDHAILAGEPTRSRTTITGSRDAGRYRAMLAANILLFFLYTGTEAGTGVWSFTLLRDGRGFSDEAAGLVTTFFWAALAAGRLSISALGARVAPRQVLAVATLGACVGLAVVWAGGPSGSPTGLLGPAGTVVTGLMLAGVFPCLVALTPERLGAERVHRAMGPQLSAAAIGVAAGPAFIGLLAGSAGAGSIAPALVLSAVLLAGVWFGSDRPGAHHLAIAGE